ncbi:hypothetical protein BJ165DRAFT_344182 [Panaeolus papilionaceus]|nr:hypothetical protein BJ165DRAFT_344182 [Panaeolus papilionaceus]
MEGICPGGPGQPFEEVDRDETQQNEAFRNTIAPITRLPVEILSRCFLIVVEDDWDSESRHHRPVCLVITHVCRQWRDVAINFPQIWSRISSFSSVWTDIQLKRSQEANFFLRIPAHPTPAATGRIVQALLKVDRLQSISYSEGKKEAASATVPILSMLDGKAAARLEHLSLKASADRDELFMTLPPTFLNGGCPRLRSVDINGFVIAWSSSLLSRFTSLKLETPSRNQPFGTLKELLDAFERMPHLSHFQLNWAIGTIIDSPDESRVVEMHKMQDCVLHTLFTDCTRILKHIALPHHASLVVEALGTGNGQEWFPCNFISSSLIPALAAAINPSCLSNPLSSSPSLRTDNPISQTAPTSLAPIHTIICINNPTNSLHRITIVFHRQDDDLNQTPSETTQAETQKCQLPSSCWQ